MSNKAKVIERYPTAEARPDVDGFWWIREGDELIALNEPREPTYSPTKAWKSAAERLDD